MKSGDIGGLRAASSAAVLLYMNTKRKSGGTLKAAAVFLVILAAVLGVMDAVIPRDIVRYSWQNEDIGAVFAINKTGDGDTATVSLFGTVPVKKIGYTVYDELMLSPCGVPFGVRLYTDGLVVVGVGDVETENGFVCPAKDAGIISGDIIKSVNGKKCTDIDSFINTVNESTDAINIVYTRSGSEASTIIKPAVCSDGVKRVGMWLRDSTAGIGTLTFVNPVTGAFAGLGHGICDGDTGALMPLSRGIIADVEISGVTKGTAGMPGELIGSFKTGKIGVMTQNTESGVFGMLTELPTLSAPMKVGLKSEVSEGPATILCTVDNTGVKEYDVVIENIRRGASDTKNFTVRIVDPDLLSKTGGIVQGMSGSPIIQNNKLIGALTHVLINDPTRGYGIFIENMFVKMPELLK